MAEMKLTVAAAGLTKRELFAVMAMQGILANGTQVQAIAQISQKHNTSPSVIVADTAVTYADDLIAELSKPTQQKAAT